MKRTPILVENGRVEISVGDAHASAPVALLEPLLRLLEASIAVVQAETPQALRTAAVSKVAKSAAVRSAPPAKAATARRAKAATGPKKYQRKSRKPVAPSLIAWLEDNPGWHHEADLLRAVVEHNMTDADPKRALMIALGKARDKTFSTDGSGHWKLKEDAAGDPPKVPARKRAKVAKSAKKPAAGRQARARKTSKTASARDNQGRKKLGTALIDWMEMHTGWQHFDELLAAVMENEMTDADPNLALKITLGKGLGRGHFETDGEQNWKLVGDGTQVEASKTVLRKASDRGKAAPAERWAKADDSAVSRARQNLLGMGRASS